ncbi:alpha/beta hydrolase [Yinghuangia soli]|uniref:Alpha/beta hydrolase family protein n=1 Tax=Yinghuangia soli TaxID=2908204 RepID=A0AA41U419_9ACTN|nr:alpha/beta hydrolase [Yinghuangia soli]MCF2528614.1 alpha/beta hydrolase family protein [Yinghuangia soli]
MVTVPQLRDASFGGLREASASLGRLAQKLEALEGQYRTTVVTTASRSYWEGTANAASKPAIDTAGRLMEVASAEVRNMVVAVDSATEEFVAAQNQLRATLTAAKSEGFVIGDDGSVSWPPEQTPAGTDPAEAEAAETRKSDRGTAISFEILGALVRATNADTSAAQALRVFAQATALDVSGPDGAARLARIQADGKLAVDLAGGLDASDIPPAGSDPKAVSAWWRAQSPNVQLAYLQAYPDRVGGLNGVPVVARDEANRTTMALELADLQRREATLDPQERRTLAALRKLDTQLTDQASDREGDAKPIYLIDIDTSGDGKWAVAVGNPDTAANTAVQVPGLNTDIEEISGEIDKARRLQFAADMQTPAADDVAVVTWLGYDAPELALEQPNTSVMGTGRAEAGAPALDQFVDTLRTTHEGDRDRLTVVGHSYGSAVVGSAASQHTLDADDIVVVGSPGTNTSHVSQMNMQNGHVWSGAASDDYVARLPQAAEAAAYAPIPGAPAIPGAYPMGAAPQDVDYGANRFDVDTSGHSNYWDPGSESVRNIGAITVGNYQDVTLNHGTAPAGAR